MNDSAPENLAALMVEFEELWDTRQRAVERERFGSFDPPVSDEEARANLAIWRHEFLRRHPDDPEVDHLRLEGP